MIPSSFESRPSFSKKSFLEALEGDKKNKTASSPSQKQEGKAPSGKLNAKPVNVIKHTHTHELADILRISDQTFFSASKKSIKEWNLLGKINRVLDHEGSLKDKEEYLALRRLNHKQWVACTNFGGVSLWNSSGERIAFQHLTRYTNGLKSENPYKNRIYTLTDQSSLQRKNLCLVGHYGGFAQYNLDPNKKDDVALNWYKTVYDTKGWVTSIDFLGDSSWLVVTGERLEVLQKPSADWNWTLKHQLVSGKVPEGFDRPFISSVKFLKDGMESPTKVAITTFDATARVIDLSTGAALSIYREHQGRVLAGETLNGNVLATTGEDRRIKIWDTRLAKSVLTLAEPNQIGPIGQIVALASPYFVTGSTPLDFETAKTLSQLTIWDMRKNS